MSEPTKTTLTSDGRIEEFEAKNSVELTNTVKDGWRVSVVKVYHADPETAATIAISTAYRAEEELRKMLPQHKEE